MKLAVMMKAHQTWGFWTMHHRLRNLGFGWNRKRVYRIYKSMELNLRSKRKKASCKGKRTIASSDLSQCNLEHEFYARHAEIR